MHLATQDAHLLNCYYLLLFVIICYYLLLFVIICYYLLLFVIIISYNYLLFFTRELEINVGCGRPTNPTVSLFSPKKIKKIKNKGFPTGITFFTIHVSLTTTCQRMRI